MPPKRKAEVVEAPKDAQKKSKPTEQLDEANSDFVTFEFHKFKKVRKEQSKRFVKWQCHEDFKVGNIMNQSAVGWLDLNKKGAQYFQSAVTDDHPVTEAKPWFRMATPGNSELKMFRTDGMEKYIRCEHPDQPGRYVCFIMSPQMLHVGLQEGGILPKPPKFTNFTKLLGSDY